MSTGKGDKMEEKIVVPLDGSKLGEVALVYIEDLLSKLSPEVKVEIILLQVLSACSPPVICGEASLRVLYNAAEMKQHRAKSMRYLKKVGKALRGKGAAIKCKVAVGFPPEEIIKTAEELNADLIALSSHGASGFSGWAFGGVTDKVIRRGGRIPITIVRVPDYRKLPLGRLADE